MAYCTSSQVAAEARISGGFRAASDPTPTNPTLERVNELIAEVDAEINTKIGMRYPTPITDTSDLILIRGIATVLVAERVVGTIEVTTGQGISVVNPKMKDGNLARQKLNDLVEGKLKLNTAPSGSPVRSFMSENDKQPTFKRDCEQW